MNDQQADILSLFQEQARNNAVYREYLDHIAVKPEEVMSIESIPFLPISLFKTHVVKTHDWPTAHIFQSSGTTGMVRSAHHVRSVSAYVEHAQQLFEAAYGPLSDMMILALLPGYAPTSSLVAMMNHFVAVSASEESGFYSDATVYADLFKKLRHCRDHDKKTLLLGVTFSLLDFIDEFQLEFPELIVMETGGMKGRKKEMTRAAIHKQIQQAFQVEHVHAEYGMTELLSQAYAPSNGIFHMNSSFHVLPGDLHDPLSMGQFGVTARLNIIDLANRDTCSFIATSDLGRVYRDGTFEVLGRLDHAQLRGCSLMYA